MMMKLFYAKTKQITFEKINLGKHKVERTFEAHPKMMCDVINGCTPFLLFAWNVQFIICDIFFNKLPDSFRLVDVLVIS